MLSSILINLNLHKHSIILFCIIRSEIFKLFIIIIITALVALLVVNGSNDGVADTLQLLHLAVQVILVGILVRVEPVFGLSNGVLDCALVVLAQLIGELILILNCVSHGEDVVLKGVFSVDLLLDCLVLVSELLSVGNHSLDLFL